MSFLLLARILSWNSKVFFLGFFFSDCSKSPVASDSNSISACECESSVQGPLTNFPFFIKKSKALVLWLLSISLLSDEDSSVNDFDWQEAVSLDWRFSFTSVISQEHELSSTVSQGIASDCKASDSPLSVVWLSVFWALWLFIKTSNALVLITVVPLLLNASLASFSSLFCSAFNSMCWSKAGSTEVLFESFDW